MKTTYVTTMPDRVGAFLRASRILAAHGANITRVSYNRAVDAHTLFIEAEGSRESLRAVTSELRDVGYLQGERIDRRPMLVNMRLPDHAGALLPVLEAIDRRQANIAYMSSAADGSGWQDYRMAVQVDDAAQTKQLLDEIAQLCEVSVLEYDPTEKILDNTVFYLSFSEEMRRLLGLSETENQSFIVNANLIMQMLDEHGEVPFKTFEYIRRFAAFVAAHKGDAFAAQITTEQVSDRVSVTQLAPPCGSNVFVLEADGELMLIDGGFPCYSEEMLACLRAVFPRFDERKKTMVLTHGDIDHVGLASVCDRVLVNADVYENFALEVEHKDDWREQTPANAAYCRLSKLITGYRLLDIGKLEIIGRKMDDAPLSYVADVEFGGVLFGVWQGNGGHVRGENVLVCPEKRIAFTGDNLVNIRGFSKEQAEFNRLAPYLMTSVNVDSEKAKGIRLELERRLKGYRVYPGHGASFTQG